MTPVICSFPSSSPQLSYDVRHSFLVSGEVEYAQRDTKEAAMMTDKKKVTKETIIGDVIKNVPGGRAIIEKYFGNGCFTCPGINMESLSFGAMMHNLDPNKIVDEINALEDK
jgi:hypothetical protein